MSQNEEENVKVLNLKEVALNPRARGWCKLPYPDHPHGCPSFGKREICPPKSQLFEKIVKSPFTLVAVKFDLERHVKKMKEKHPEWSDRRARCVLYWQKKVDKQLREVCERIASDNSVILYKPEANGVNLFLTCRKIGLALEKNPQKIVWKIAIIGNKK